VINKNQSKKGRSKGSILEKVRVENYAAEGKSIARVDGRVVFIEQVAPGDVVDIRLTKTKKDWAEGYPLHFHSYSDLRIDPFCAHFGICGGCQWQMLSYENQLSFKRQQVEDNLKRIGKLSLPDIPPVLGADETRYYRNKIEYTFSSKQFIPETQFRSLAEYADPGEMNPVSRANAAGFHARRFFDKVVEIEHCHLQAEPSNAIRKTIASFARENNYSFYDYRLHSGFLRVVQIRMTAGGEVMVNLVMGKDDRAKRDKILEHLLNRIPGISTLVYMINTKWNDSLHDLDPVVVTGEGYITETLGDFRFRIGPKTFFQTNTRQAEKLYTLTRDFAELSGNEILFDLYCGTGSIGIFCGRKAKKIIGVELIEEAVADAKENALLNNIHHATFISGDVIKICDDQFFSSYGKPDVIITDPPRAGMHERLVKKIGEISAPLLVYVSCNPATQARDLSLLDEKYAVTRIQPVDMFPHTHHIENVVQLKLR